MKNILLLSKALHPSLIFLVFISFIFFYLGIYETNTGRYVVIVTLIPLFWATMVSQKPFDRIDAGLAILIWVVIAYLCFLSPLLTTSLSILFGTFFVIKLASISRDALDIYRYVQDNFIPDHAWVNEFLINNRDSWIKREAAKAGLALKSHHQHKKGKIFYRKFKFRLGSIFSLMKYREIFRLSFWKVLEIK